MTRGQSIAYLMAVVAACAWAQDAATLPEFEVVSVKSSGGLGGQMGQERDKGWGDVTGRVNLRFIPLREVLLHAYGIQRYQLDGPAWMFSEYFHISAIVPAGTPKAKIPLMFQSMLARQFDLKCHWETRPTAVYALVVARGGPKMERASREAAELEIDTPSRTTDTGKGDDRVITTASVDRVLGKRIMTVDRDGLHDEFPRISMDGLARYLNGLQLDMPVVNMTDLSGGYHVTVTTALGDLPSLRAAARQGGAENGSAASDPVGRSCQESLKKAGLQLVRRKVPIKMLIVDHVERTPKEE